MFHVAPSVKPNSIPTGKQLVSVETRQGQSWWAAAPRPGCACLLQHRPLRTGSWGHMGALGRLPPHRGRQHLNVPQPW